MEGKLISFYSDDYGYYVFLGSICEGFQNMKNENQQALKVVQINSK